MMNTDERIGFGIVGLGYGSTRCPLILNIPEARLVAVVARNEEKASKVANEYDTEYYTDYRYLLDRKDVDVICVYTPSGFHQEIAVEAAKAGKHLIITKPIEISLEATDAILNSCEEAGVNLAVEYIFRYRPGNYTVKHETSRGLFGDLILGEFSWKCFRSQAYYQSDEGWRGTWKVDGGGAIMNQTIHYVDQLLWIMGEVESVTSQWGTFTHQIETEDTAAALIKFKSGAIGTLIGTTTFQNDRKPHTYGSDVKRLEVNGKLGSATLIDGEITMWKEIDGNDEPPLAAPPAENVYQDFVRWLKSGEDYSSLTLTTGDEARRAVELVIAIYASANSGETINLPLKRDIRTYLDDN